MVIVPRAHPKEFRDDVVAVVRTGYAPIAEVVKDFGNSERPACAADVEGRRRPRPKARSQRRRFGRAARA